MTQFIIIAVMYPQFVTFGFNSPVSNSQKHNDRRIKDSFYNMRPAHAPGGGGGT